MPFTRTHLLFQYCFEEKRTILEFLGCWVTSWISRYVSFFHWRGKEVHILWIKGEKKDNSPNSQFAPRFCALSCPLFMNKKTSFLILASYCAATDRHQCHLAIASVFNQSHFLATFLHLFPIFCFLGRGRDGAKNRQSLQSYQSPRPPCPLLLPSQVPI